MLVTHVVFGFTEMTLAEKVVAIIVPVISAVGGIAGIIKAVILCKKCLKKSESLHIHIYILNSWGQFVKPSILFLCFPCKLSPKRNDHFSFLLQEKLFMFSLVQPTIIITPQSQVIHAWQCFALYWRLHSSLADPLKTSFVHMRTLIMIYLYKTYITNYSCYSYTTKLDTDRYIYWFLS